MKWNKIKVYTSSEALDLLAAMLIDIGINGFEVQDKEDFKEFLTNTTPHWDYVDDDLMKLADAETNITLYLPTNAQGRETFLALRDNLERLKKNDEENALGSLRVEEDTIDEEDWANNWKKYFKPFPVGKNFLIKPSWEEAKDTRGKTVIEIDPGTAFGTGMHETTSLCIELIEETMEKEDRVLDIGTGSGILSIAALLCGAQSAFACDIDEKAIETSVENAKRNRVEERYTARRSDLLQSVEGIYDLVLANIVADAIIELFSKVREVMKKDATFIVSGIIEEREEDVKRAAEQNAFTITGHRKKNGWVAFCFK